MDYLASHDVQWTIETNAHGDEWALYACLADVRYRLTGWKASREEVIAALQAALSPEIHPPAPQTAPPMVHSVIDPRLDQRLPTMAKPPEQPPPPTEEE